MDKIIEAIIILSAVSSIEDLDETTMDKFEHYSTNPIEINCASRTKLLSSGLFSAFQVASILDYRNRSGDILSASELSLIDGFAGNTAGALQYFVSFRSSPEKALGKGEYGKMPVMVKALGRSSWRNDKSDLAYGFKTEATIGEYFELGWASRTTYSDTKFGLGTLNATFYGKKTLGKLIIGDFNARFGQGLLAWNGFQLSSFYTAASICRNASGLSPSRSFSESRHGAAADLSIGKNWVLSAAVSRDPEAMLNITRIGSTLSLGATIKAVKGSLGASIDWKKGFKGGTVFGEAAFENAWKVLVGAFYVPSYGSKVAGRTFWSVNEHSAAMAWSGKWWDASLEAVRKATRNIERYRATLILKPSVEVLKAKLDGSLRLGAKYYEGRTRLMRYDCRAEAGFARDGLSLRGRYDAVYGRDYAWLWYAEAGWNRILSAYLRGGIFKIDNWDDRIYVYERDAPGSFNVPAYYGRGWTASAVIGWKTKKRALYLRASSINYPWMKKESVFEIKLQYSRTFRREFRSDGPSR